jgi:hypothetical protein
LKINIKNILTVSKIKQIRYTPNIILERGHGINIKESSMKVLKI